MPGGRPGAGRACGPQPDPKRRRRTGASPAWGRPASWASPSSSSLRSSSLPASSRRRSAPGRLPGRGGHPSVTPSPSPCLRSCLPCSAWRCGRSSRTSRNPELALPRLTTDVLPPWVGGLAFAALFAAEISTADAVLFMLSTSLSRDLFQAVFRPKATDAELLRVGRLAAAGGGALGVLLALVLPSVASALKIFYGIMTAALFMPLVIRPARAPSGGGSRPRRDRRFDTHDRGASARARGQPARSVAPVDRGHGGGRGRLRDCVDRAQRRTGHRRFPSESVTAARAAAGTAGRPARRRVLASMPEAS